jgi:hypothetical protein
MLPDSRSEPDTRVLQVIELRHNRKKKGCKVRKHNNCPDLLPMKLRGTSTKVFLEAVM